MKTLIFFGLLIFTIVYWTEVSNFVSANVGGATDKVAKWMVENTPKK